MNKFWEKFSEGLAETWNAQLLIPASAFLGIGILAWVWRYGFNELLQKLNAITPTAGIAIAIAGLFLLAILGWIVQRSSIIVLRICEGYWPGVLARLSRSMANRVAEKIDQKKQRRQALAQRFDQLSEGELDEYNRLDAELMTYPKKSSLYLPTRLGNLLRAAEEYSNVRYGLEISVTWPRLWFVLPEDVRKEINIARGALDERTQLLTWGALAVVWTVWAWWAVLVAAGVVWIAYMTMVEAAGIYGDLLHAAFDLHRFELYKSVHWKLPDSPADEETSGEALTQYLHRGSVPEDARFEKG